MTWSAVGSFLQSTNVTSWSLNNQAAGNLVLIATVSDSTANYVSGVSAGGCTWTEITPLFQGTTNNRACTVWAGTVTATGSQTATVTVSSGTYFRTAGGEFHSTAGSWSLDVAGHLDSAGTNTWPSVTPAAAGELYFGFAFDSGSASAGSTSGYTYNVTSGGNGCAWNPSCTSAAQSVGWGDSSQTFGSMLLIKEAAGAATSGPVMFPAVRTVKASVTWRGGRRGAHHSL